MNNNQNVHTTAVFSNLTSKFKNLDKSILSSVYKLQNQESIQQESL